MNSRRRSPQNNTEHNRRSAVQPTTSLPFKPLPDEEITMTLIPRMVGFDASGIAVGAGFSSVVEQAHSHKIMMLPSENPDFIDYDVVGKTQAQIQADIDEKVI